MTSAHNRLASTFLGLSIIIPNLSHAANGLVLASTSGTCSEAKIDDRSYACNGIIYMYIQSAKRANWSVAVEGKIFVFSGSSDKQPSIGEYILQIDTISDPANNKRIPANGQCIAHLSDDASHLYDVMCEATYNGKKASLKFKSDGKPFELAK